MVVSFLIKDMNYHLSHLPQRFLWGSSEMVFVLWKLNSAVQMCPITLRRKYKLFTQPSLLPMAVTTPSVSSLCFPPISPAHTTLVTPASFLFLNLPICLLPWGPYTCSSPKGLLCHSNLFSLSSSPLQRGHPWSPLSNHHHPSTFPETHSIPYTALFIKVLINSKNYIIHLFKMAFICLPH